MEGPRPPFENEYEKVLHFVTEALRPQIPWMISDEYPTAFNHSNLNNIRVMFDDQNVVSHALFKPMMIKTPALSIKVAIIGSVTTAPTHRNQGLSRTVIDDCLKNAIYQNCDLAVLWSDIPDFYRKMGFEYAGTELQYEIDRPLQTKATANRVLESNQISPESLLQLYRKHSVSSERSNLDIQRYLKIPKTRIFTSWDPQNQLMAYAVLGKGADLQNHIHEWGGSIPDLFAVLNRIRELSSQKIYLMVPQHSKNLIRHLETAHLSKQENFFGLLKILRPECFCLKINSACRSLGVRDVEFQYSNGIYEFGSSQNRIKTQSPQDLLRLVYGPWAPGEIFSMPPELHATLTKVFPLPLWIWGWDSI